MHAPKCRICGEKHYGLCAVNKSAANKPVNTPKANAPVNAGVNARIRAEVDSPLVDPAFLLRDEVERLKARIAELEAENRALLDRANEKPKPDRKAYMREYMRRRRQS